MNYSAVSGMVDGIEVVRLSDAARGVEVSIAPTIGNMAYEFLAHGKNSLWFPYRSPGEFKQRPKLCGVPFLAPWANRIDGDSYRVNGREYRLNPELGNLRRDTNQKPIHGLLSFSSAWTLAAAGADRDSAYATSRIEFWKHPDLVAQFPFAHSIAMTHRLRDGALEVETAIENHSVEPMPVAIGYHPYLRLYDAPREHWKVRVAARDHMVLNHLLLPTGERKPVQFPGSQTLGTAPLDDVFTNLVRDPDGRARFCAEADAERITVTYGPKYTVAVVYAPPGSDFICFEPMAAIPNAFLLAHAEVYEELQSIPPGGEWRESFWIEATAS